MYNVNMSNVNHIDILLIFILFVKMYNVNNKTITTFKNETMTILTLV